MCYVRTGWFEMAKTVDFDSDRHTFYNETIRKIKRRIKSFTDRKIIKLI